LIEGNIIYKNGPASIWTAEEPHRISVGFWFGKSFATSKLNLP
jgi:hypothetical protein